MTNRRAKGDLKVGVKRKAEVEARWKQFWQDHENFEPTWARSTLNLLSEFLTFVFEGDAVRHGMEQLYVRSGVKCPPDFDWNVEWTGAHARTPVDGNKAVAHLPFGSGIARLCLLRPQA